MGIFQFRGHEMVINPKKVTFVFTGQYTSIQSSIQEYNHTTTTTNNNNNSQDIRMEFGIEKWAMLVMKSDKRHLTDGMEQPNQDKIRTLREKETYKYLGILKADNIKQVEMKQKIKKEYFRRTRKQLKTKRSSRNLIKGINTWAVSLVRYSGPFLKWTREELKQMDQRTRKLMTMHKASHPRDDVDRLYVSRKEGGRGLASLEDSVDASIQRLHRKRQRRTDYSYQKRYWQHEGQQNDNN